MAKKAKSEARQKATWQGYVNFNPSEDEREAIRGNVLAPDKFERWVAKMADDGYRVSFKLDAYRDSLVCELYAQWQDMENAGRTLVCAHNDVLVAASAVAWFHETIASGGTWPTQRDLSNPYDW